MLEELLGKTTRHLVLFQDRYFIHKKVLDDFKSLVSEGLKRGFSIELVSSFRDYQAQLGIWNAKALGSRVLLDDQGMELDYSLLSSREVLYAILRWSAIPGFSRHHWGSDLDIFDSNKMKQEDVRLTPQEVAPKGACGELHLWLDEYLPHSAFFRPYAQDLGGVQVEKWHLSHREVSRDYFKNLNLDFFIDEMRKTSMMLAEEVLSEAEKIFCQFVVNVSDE